MTTGFQNTHGCCHTGIDPAQFFNAGTGTPEKAVNLATAKAWVQGKRALAPASTGRAETEQPRETQSPEYLPFSGTDTLLWTFSGSYGWTYASGLDGVW